MTFADRRTAGAIDHPAARPHLLHEFFRRRVEAVPDRIALDIPPGRSPARLEVTYRALSARADLIAARIAPLVAGESLVAVLLPRTSPDAYAAPIGILQAGAAWLPLDASFPAARLHEILDDSGAVAVVTDAAGAAMLQRESDGHPPLINVADLAADAAPPQPAPPAWLAPGSLAYVIYTSGTSGRPKGVMIEHGAIANLVSCDRATFALPPDSRCGQSSSHAYDSSIEEIWLAFAAGATLVVLDDEVVRSGPDLVPWLDRERVSVLCPSPTQLRTMGCRRPEDTPRALSLLYVGGEPLPRDLADVWAPGRRLVNGYGPTECAVTALRAPVLNGHPITIGRPVTGLTAWVLDQSLEPVPDGESGELCIGGVGLARGYLNAPDLTAAAFIEHPRLGRLYRTGDRARLNGDGTFVHEGRLDSQVKLRGYRMELEEIESRLAALAGVRAAGCRLDGHGARAVLSAFVVPERPEAPPDARTLRDALAATLPAYMVPATIRIIDGLPLNAGGKLDRGRLPASSHDSTPATDAGAREAATATAASSDLVPAASLDARLRSSIGQVLGRAQPIGEDDDFFRDLGGDSLAAAELVTRLRDDRSTASVTVRDVYEAPTVRQLAARLRAAAGPSDRRREHVRRSGRPSVAAAVQAAWIALEVAVSAAFLAWVLFVLLPPALLAVGLVPAILLTPLALGALTPAYAFMMTAVAVATKRVLIGRYTPRRAPVWSAFYLRHWIVQRAAARIPWRVLQGTVFEIAVLRALGARIGERVHIHRGVNLHGGGWDLLTIEDDAAIGQEAALRVVDLEDGEIVFAPVYVGRGATIGVRAGLSGGSVVEAGAWLTPLSSLPAGGRVPAGERWDGVPARPSGDAPARPAITHSGTEWTSVGHGVATLGATLAVALALVLPLDLVAIALAVVFDADAAALLAWFFSPSLDTRTLVAALALGLLPVPLSLVLQAVAMRALGRIPTGVISRWSPAYLRVWIKTGLLERAGDLLAGTLFWPVWLRAAGMRIGLGSEISTIIDVVPEHITIGRQCFFADGIYLGGPIVSQGTVTLAPTTFGSNVFIGNHAVIPAGQAIPDDVLIGVCTVVDDRMVRRGTSWFGHPPFELPRRPLEGWDRRLTHEPTLLLYLARVFWEAARGVILLARLAVDVGWLAVVGLAIASGSAITAVVVVAPAAALAAGAVLCGCVLALKWALLGRVSPGAHAFWSCWCGRWDFLYVAWERLARPVLATLEGTPLLTGYLRAMGATIGRHVVLGPGFAQVVDPDMIHIEDEATVHALFQAHTFEDRVLKIDHLWIRRGATVQPGAVLFYGADVGAHALVAPHSVVMKRERLLPGGRYEGCPTREA